MFDVRADEILFEGRTVGRLLPTLNATFEDRVLGFLLTAGASRRRSAARVASDPARIGVRHAC